MPAGEITDAQAIRGWRLTAAREAVGIGSARALAEFIADYARGKGDPSPRGFSARTLHNIEAGRATLSPQAADYIAGAIGISPTFFNAPIERLGDTGHEVPGSASTPYGQISQRAAAQHAVAEDALSGPGRPTPADQQGSGQEDRRSA